MANLKDIALRAGVSLSTVSRALKDSHEIGKETKVKIYKIARELNYISEKDLPVFAGDSSYSIGLICPEIKGDYYPQLVYTIEEKMKINGYTLIIGFSNFKYEDELHYLELFVRKAVDGIILISSVGKRIEEELRTIKTKSNIPIIQVVTTDVVDEYDSIKIDDEYGISIAIKHLIELGHKDIGYVGDEMSKRLVSFLNVMKNFNIKINNDYIRDGNDRFEEGGYKRMSEILALKKRPTAVFASYDAVAIGAMKAIYEHGLRIPDDISIVGIDNTSVAHYLPKGLTTVSSPINEMGIIISRILLSKIENKYSVVQHVSLNPTLVIRESTAKIPDM